MTEFYVFTGENDDSLTSQACVAYLILGIVTLQNAHLFLRRPLLSPVIHHSNHWLLVLNFNQNLLGKCFLALRRHAESIVDLTTDEWGHLHDQVSRATGMLTAAFRPEHFNYAFLQNQDPHVHLHILPRYARSISYQGLTFEADFPGPWPAHPRPLEDGIQEMLVKRLEALVNG